MGNNNQRALCQQLWAENKYLVLSHSSNIYKDIRQYLKQEVVELSQVQEMIDRACQLPEHRGQVCNAFQHIWGYFKKQASLDERKDYMLLLDRYRFGQASKEDLIARTRDLLERYPNAYLQDSILLKGDSHEALISQLPRPQLLGQHRECCALRGNGWGRKHATVDYVFTHSPYRLYAYHRLIMEEMADRGYNVSPEWLDKNYRGKTCPPYENLAEEKLNSPIYSEHDATYYEECLANLREKGIELE